MVSGTGRRRRARPGRRSRPPRRIADIRALPARHGFRTAMVAGLVAAFFLSYAGMFAFFGTG
jgi:hypothetical protein